MTDLVVLIATAGRPDLLIRTLASLEACSKPEQYRQTLVVENGEAHGVERIVSKYADTLRARYLYVESPNKSSALNAGLQLIGDAFVLFTDDDVRFDRDVLVAYASAVQEDYNAIYGGPMGVDYEEPPEEWLVPFLPASARGWEPDELGRSHLEFMGINWLVHARHVRAAGGFDESRGPGGKTRATGQEMAMQSLLRRRGLPTKYVPEARVWHYVPKTRCSPDWVLDRSYRSGMSFAIDSADGGLPRLGLPRWVAVRSASTWLRSVTGILQGGHRSRFALQNKRRYNRGLRAGIRAAQRMRRVRSLEPGHPD